MNHSNDQQTLQQPTPINNQGPWSKAQHQLFLAAIDIHGKDWKNIALMVVTRQESQVRSHAQKYNNKLQNDRERIGVGAVEIRGENGVAITRSRSRGNTQTRNPEDPTPNTNSNPRKTKKINKDQEKSKKGVLVHEVKKKEKKKKAPKVSIHKIIIPLPLWYSNYRTAAISNQPQRSFYYDPAMGSHLEISAFSAFYPYGSQENTRENLPRGMATLGNQNNQDFQ